MHRLPAGTTILVLEDEPLIRLDIEHMLQTAGFAAIGADSVANARAALAGQLPRVAILDALLPGGDSFALARELAATGTAMHHTDRNTLHRTRRIHPGVEYN